MPTRSHGAGPHTAGPFIVRALLLAALAMLMTMPSAAGRGVVEGRPGEAAPEAAAKAVPGRLAATSTGRDRVEVLQLHGVLDGALADYARDGLAEAAAADAAVVVLQLNMPGALDVDVAALAQEVAASPVPVVAYVGPAGAQLAGGGLALYQAAHVRAVSRATMLGPALPVDLARAARGADGDPARLRRAGPATGPDAAWLTELSADAAIVAAPPGVDELPEGVELPAGVAAEDVRVVEAGQLAGTGVADIAAASLPDVLRAVDGRRVSVRDPDTGQTGPRSITVDPGSAQTRFNNPGLLTKFLHGLASPALVYLLLTAALLSLAFEWFQPGFGVAGVAGMGLAVVGAVGLWVLPFGWVGLALVVLGAVLLSIDTAAGGFGLITAVGLAAFGAGSWWLFPDVALLRPAWWVIAAVVAFVAVYYVGILTSVLRAQGQQASADAQQLVGQTAIVRSMLNPEGHVFAAGNLWRAKAPEAAGKVKTGTRVRVVGLDDRLTLQVQLLGDDSDTSQEPAPQA